ncbi:MFS transporter [Pectobacterium carotovorum]
MKSILKFSEHNSQLVMMMKKQQFSPSQNSPSTRAIFFIGAAQIAVWGGSFFILSVLARPIMEDTGWARQWVYGGLSLGIFISGILLPWVGKCIKRYGGREILAGSGAVAALGLIIIACTHTLPWYIFAWIILGIAMAMGLYDSLYAVLGNSYGQGAKTAITTVTLISGFCTTIVWPLLAFGVTHVGWRATCLVWAAVLIVTVWPIYRISLPASPITPSRKPKQQSNDASVTIDKNIYLLMSTIFMLAAIIMTVISVQLIDILQDGGMSLTGAVGVTALIGPSQVAARVMDIVIKFKHPVLSLLVSVVLVLTGLILIAIFPKHAVFAVIVYGCGNGLRSIVRGTLPLAILRPNEFAVVMGRIARPSLIAQGATPIVSALLFEHFGTGTLMLTLVTIAALSVILSLVLHKRIQQFETEKTLSLLRNR